MRQLERHIETLVFREKGREKGKKGGRVGEKEGGRTQEVTWFLFLLLKAQNSLLEDGEGSECSLGCGADSLVRLGALCQPGEGTMPQGGRIWMRVFRPPSSPLEGSRETCRHVARLGLCGGACTCKYVHIWCTYICM